MKFEGCEQDPSLSARLIATVNTAAGGTTGRVVSRSQELCHSIEHLAIRNLVQAEAIRDVSISVAVKAVFEKMACAVHECLPCTVR